MRVVYKECTQAAMSMQNLKFYGADVETASDGYASRFQGAAGEYLLSVQERSIRDVMPDMRGMSVLDVGGGHGQTSALMLREGRAVTVLGSAPQAHDRLRKSPIGGRCTLVTGDILALPFDDGAFDLVMSVRLLPHTPSWPRLVAEMCRVARRWVIVDYPRPVGINALTPVLFGLKRRIEGNTREYINFSDATISTAFGDNGFAVTKRVGQFVMPMVVHRLTNARFSRGVETAALRLGLTNALGSPAIIRADRTEC